MKWEDIKDEVIYAIETDVTQEEFLLSKDLTRGQWYGVKPKGFKWRSVKKEGGFTKTPSHEPNPCIETEDPSRLCQNTICENEMVDSSGLCMLCTNFLLKNIIMLFRKGFTEKVIKSHLG
jgi:hypothetical protein